jgi:methyl-accepting chemotaxis protein
VLILRRRTFVINRKLQFSMMATSLCYVGLLVLVVSTALFAPLILQLSRPELNATDASDAALRIIYLHETYWLPVLLTLLAIALHSVSASHRIAGPIYRFRRVCEAMAAGVVPKPVTLREHDHLKTEMDVVNAMLDRWRTLVVQAQREATRLHESVSTYRDLSASSRDDAAAGAVLADIVRTEQRLHDALAGLSCEAWPDTGHAPAIPRQ